VRDVSDRRRVGVRITDAGRRDFAAKEELIRAAWEAELDGAGDEDLDAMLLALKRVSALFDAF
jgi:DNA-binding MarR family transcriptional regulator